MTDGRMEEGQVMAAYAARVFRHLSPIWIVLAVVIVLAAVISDRFLVPQNVVAVLQQGVITGLVALGMTIVLIGGEFDLSTGSTVMMAAVVSLLMGPSTPMGLVAAIVVPLGLGGLIGWINGVAVFRAGANSIVTTIGMQFFVLGAVLALVGGQHVRGEAMHPAFSGLALWRPFGVPLPVFLFAALVGLAAVMMAHTVLGRHIYAAGGDRSASTRAGINVTRVGTATFVMSGMLAALAGVIIAAMVGVIDPTAIARYEFPALTAAVLGGTSLAGGVGRPADTAAAILIVSIITNVMTLLDYQYSWQLMVQGVVLTAAVAFYAWQRGEA
jgi:ribose transport system permease protein